MPSAASVHNAMVLIFDDAPARFKPSGKRLSDNLGHWWDEADEIWRNENDDSPYVEAVQGPSPSGLYNEPYFTPPPPAPSPFPTGPGAAMNAGLTLPPPPEYQGPGAAMGAGQQFDYGEPGSLAERIARYGQPNRGLLGEMYQGIDRGILKPLDWMAKLGADVTPQFLDVLPGGEAVSQLYRAGERGLDRYGPDWLNPPDLPSAASSRERVRQDILHPGRAVEEFRQRPLAEQIAAGAIFDPTNLIGVGYGPDIVSGARKMAPGLARAIGAVGGLPSNVARSVSPKLSITEQLSRGAINPQTGKAFDIAPILGGAQSGFYRGQRVVDAVGQEWIVTNPATKSGTVTLAESMSPTGRALGKIKHSKPESVSAIDLQVEQMQARDLSHAYNRAVEDAGHAEAMLSNEWANEFYQLERSVQAGKANVNDIARHDAIRSEMEDFLMTGGISRISEVPAPAGVEAAKAAMAAERKLRRSGDVGEVIREGRAKQFARIEESISSGKAAGLSSAEILDRASSAAGVGPLTSTIAVVPEGVNAEGLKNILLTAHESGLITTPQLLTANNALKVLLSGERVLQPAEDRILRIVFGDTIIDKLAPVGKLKPFGIEGQPDPTVPLWKESPELYAAETIDAGFIRASKEIDQTIANKLGQYEDFVGSLPEPTGTGVPPRYTRTPPTQEGVQPRLLGSPLAKGAEHPGPSRPIDLIQQRDLALSEWTLASQEADDLEHVAMGLSKTNWQGQRSQRRGGKALSRKGKANEDKLWRKELTKAGNGEAVMKAAESREYADTLLNHYSELAKKYQPRGVQIQTPGTGEMRTRADITPEGNLVLRPQFAADVELGVTPHLGEARSVAAARRSAELAAQRNAIWETTVDILNLPRAFKTGFDLSATLRQSAPLGVVNPKEWMGAFSNQWKAAMSGEAADQIEALIHTRPMAKLSEKAGLFLSSASKRAQLEAREEFFMTRWAGKIPLLKQSERAYVVMLDSLRANVFDKTVEKWLAQGYVPTEHDLRRLGDFVNHATGRGTGTALDKMGTVASLGLFAPRYWISKPQLLWDVVRPGNSLVRLEATKAVSAWLAEIVGLGGLAYIAGGEVGLNPLAGNFGQVGYGDYSFDVTSGFAGDIRGAARVATGKLTTREGETLDINPASAFGRYVRGKLSPQAALAIDLLSGRDYMGSPTNPLSLGGFTTDVINLFGNLFMQDVYDAFRTEIGSVHPIQAAQGGQFFEGTGEGLSYENFLRLAGAAAGSFFGASSQIDIPSQSDILARQLYDKDSFDALSAKEQAELRRDRPEAFVSKSDRGKLLTALRADFQSRLVGLGDRFQEPTGGMTVSAYSEGRKTLVSQNRGAFEVATEGLPDKKSADETWQSYLALFDKATDLQTGLLDNETFAYLEHQWATSHDEKYVQEVLAAQNQPPVEKERRADMNTLAVGGYFDRKRLPRYKNLPAGIDERETERLEQRVSVERQLNPEMADALEWIPSAIYVLQKEGYSTAQIQAVLAVHQAKNAMSTLKESGRATEGLKWANIDFFKFKLTHQGELAWFEDDFTWADIQRVKQKASGAPTTVR